MAKIYVLFSIISRWVRSIIHLDFPANSKLYIFVFWMLVPARSDLLNQLNYTNLPHPHVGGNYWMGHACLPVHSGCPCSSTHSLLAARMHAGPCTFGLTQPYIWLHQSWLSLRVELLFISTNNNFCTCILIKFGGVWKGDKQYVD